MRIKNRILGQPNIEIIVIPRSDTIGPDGKVIKNDIILKAQAVLDYGPFQKLVPEPKMRVKLVNEGGKTRRVDDEDNESYKKEKEQYARLHMAWLVIQSLAVNQDLEWDTVKETDPTTWENWSKEFTDAGFTQIEQGMLLRGILSANGLDDARIAEARSNFLAQAPETA